MMRVAAGILLLVAISGRPPQVFRGGVDAVRVDVLVTDGGRPVAGLTADRFVLLDSGVPQKLQSVTTDDVPVSMMMALDTSTSVDGVTLTYLKQAVRTALQSLGPHDRAALLTFGSVVELDADWGALPGAVDAALGRARARGSTSLYDAAFAALTLRDSAPGTRGLIVLFSDGADTASWLPRRAGLEKASRTDVVVYAVMARRAGAEGIMHYRSGVELWRQPATSARRDPFVEELADLTGGSLLVADAGRLRSAFASIVTEFRNRYILSYTPEGVAPGGWHSIEVKLHGRRGTVKARRGYIRDSP